MNVYELRRMYLNMNMRIKYICQVIESSSGDMFA